MRCTNNTNNTNANIFTIKTVKAATTPVVAATAPVITTLPVASSSAAAASSSAAATSSSASVSVAAMDERVSNAAMDAIELADKILVKGYFTKGANLRTKTTKTFLNQVRLELTTVINTLIGICNTSPIREKIETEIAGLTAIIPTIIQLGNFKKDTNVAADKEINATITAATDLKRFAVKIDNVAINNEPKDKKSGGKRHSKHSKTHKKHGKRSKTHRKRYGKTRGKHSMKH